MSRFGLVGQSNQEQPNGFGHVGLLPVVVDGEVALLDLEPVAELVRSARSAHAGLHGVGGQQRRNNLLLVRGQIGRVEAGDHVQTCEAATADEFEVHQPNVTPATLDAHRSGAPTGSLSGFGP